MTNSDAPLGREASAELGGHPRGASPSLEMIRDLAPDRGVAILDVGGGTSALVERLIDDGFADLTVLNMAEGVLQRGRHQLGERASRVRWLEADVLIDTLPERSYDLWHDAAVFHTLSSNDHRRVYLDQLRRALRPGGYAIIATYRGDRPERHHGIVDRPHGPDVLADQLGEGFERVEQKPSWHDTGLGAVVDLAFNVFRRR